MIKSFRLKAGRVPGGPPEDVEAAAVNVFVGPNNSGKSALLQEFARYIEDPRTPNLRVLGSLRYAGLRPHAAAARLESLMARVVQPVADNRPNIVSILGHVVRGYQEMRVDREEVTRLLIDPSTDPHRAGQLILLPSTITLNGSDRLSFRSVPQGDPARPQNTIQAIFYDPEKLKKVRRVLLPAFGKYFVIDPTRDGQLGVKFSDRPPANIQEEQGLDPAARAFHAAATHIGEMSDGVRAFTGIISEIIAGDPQVLLIDEPEAFLHPALAHRLGSEIALDALETKRVFASTHSAAFVQGCLSSGKPVNIIRLTYSNAHATARVLPSAELIALMRDALLRSSGVLNAIFYSAVVVCEADADRVFYDEVNHRLLRFDETRAISDCLFINAQNKHTIRRIVGPLRKLGVAAAAIVDIDVVKDGGQTWTNLLKALGVPEVEHIPLGEHRAAIKRALEATGNDMKREGGLTLLREAERESANNLFGTLEKYGLFVVPCGELECWLADLRIAKSEKTDWLVKTLQAMHDEPSEEGYVKPGRGDVWDFIARIRRWIEDPSRRGMPN